MGWLEGGFLLSREVREKPQPHGQGLLRHGASVHLAQLVASSHSHVMEEGFIHEPFAEGKWSQTAGVRKRI